MTTLWHQTSDNNRVTFMVVQNLDRTSMSANLAYIKSGHNSQYKYQLVAVADP